MNENGNFSPSSFIPFCYFGEEFIGARVNEFKTPVCNIFRPRIYLNQLCYETNLQAIRDSQKIEKKLESGLTLVLDYNEERQYYNSVQKNKSQAKEETYQNNDDVSIYLDTISSLDFD